MNLYSRSFLRLIDQQPKSLIKLIISISIILLGFLDYITGSEISFALFYLFPVVLASWRLGSQAGLGISIICSIMWLLSNLLAGAMVSHAWIHYWNMGIRFGFFSIVTSLVAEIKQLLEYERSLVNTDYLTGAMTSRSFYERLDVEINRSLHDDGFLTVLYIDLDNFKKINDQQGHYVGDILLKSVAMTMLENVRSIDVVARLGGDEFVILMPDTNLDMAKQVIPRMQGILLAVMDQNYWPVTFSMGAIICQPPPNDSQELICLADQAMYTVKNNDKNSILYVTYP